MSKIPSKKKRITQPRKKFYYSKTIIITMGMLFLTLFLFVLETQRVQEHRSRAAGTNCDAPAAEVAANAEEQKMLKLINDYRATKGAGPVTISQKLTQSATWLSADMNKTKNMSHTDSLGRDVQKRIPECGYSAAAYGENISAGGPLAQTTFDLWRNSKEGHNEEMLAPNRKVVGIAQVGDFWTLDTGTDEDAPLGTPQITGDPGPGASPSFYPLAPCPGCSNPGVTQVPATAQPTTAIEPTSDPSVSLPVVQNPNPSDKPSPGHTGKQGGLIGLLLGFLLLILKFIAGLFGK